MPKARRISATPFPADSSKAARQAFDSFKADPSSPHARTYLRWAIDFAEGVTDAGERAMTAGLIARELARVVEQASPSERREITKSISVELAASSAVRDAFGQKETKRVSETFAPQGERAISPRFVSSERPGREPGADRPLSEESGSTRSFEFHLGEFLEKNPRFAGMGRLVLDGGADNGVKVEKKEPPAWMHPWWYRQRWKIAIGTIIAGLSVFSAVAVFSRPGDTQPHPGSSIRAQAARSQESDSGTREDAQDTAQQSDGGKPLRARDGARDEGNRITPDETSILRAVDEAVRQKDAPLNLQQIFDIFNYILRNVRYLNVSDRAVPRWPAETLAARWGDCKSMSVLLASMLESIGAKTVLISWHDSATRNGHEYVGVMVSEETDANLRREAERQVRRRIEAVFSRTISQYYRRPLPLHFREYTIGGRTQLYLILDATGGRHGVPGIALERPEIERMSESRPGHRGNVPNMR